MSRASNATVVKVSRFHAEVPFDFDGKFGGVCTGEAVRSTKGRYLNYAFGKVNSV
ncbi:MAG: hypothetical protein R2883_00670 [Caldisericia bacterium]